MIVAIERSKFTYLYKYNQIRIDINQVIDHSVENLKWMLQFDENSLIHIFNKAIPLFEQDHEIILIEVDKSKVKFQDGILLSFDSLNSIYPLTIIGSQLLDGKISDDFIIKVPIFEICIESIKINRSMDFRRKASEKILAHYKLDSIVNKGMTSAIEASVRKNLIDKYQPQVFTTFLDHLIAYNTTPSYIPDGNIEYIAKIGAIAIKYLGKQDDVFTNGPFYKSCIKYKSQVNNKSYAESYAEFISIAYEELKSSYEKMIELISNDNMGVDIFKISYFYLAFKSYINKHDNNIEGINNEIVDLVKNDKNTSAFVLSLLGYTFSFEKIYEGLHRLSNAPLLLSTQKKKIAETEMIKREEPGISKQGNGITKDIEQDNNILKEDIFSVDGQLRNSQTENDLIPSKEENEVVVDSSSVENDSEPIINYGIIAKQEIQENEKSIDNNSVKIDLNSNDLVEQNETVSNKDSLTVQVFKSYLTSEIAKTRQKNWFQFLDLYFPTNNEILSYETLEKILDGKPEMKEMLFKVKKDKELIITFFDSFK